MREPNRGDSGDERFLRLSAVLTGFGAAELRATGMAGAHRELVERWAGPALVGRLAAATGADVYVPGGGDEEADELARAVCHLWYVGVWPGAGGPAHPPGEPAARAYENGLVWRTFGARPPGTAGPGPGSWSLPPAADAPAGPLPGPPPGPLPGPPPGPLPGPPPGPRSDPRSDPAGSGAR
ncbi:hypothetical protein [Streptomyces sp. CAU 1734]|uniref:hypothetical protein n=1 Tax=Streptomyces sp. CAU 1734 TaxID=3140360 RepID=UPI0032608424